MSNLNEITAADVEHSFGVATESGRFASLCNALLAAKAASAAVGYPALSEKPGADGSFDGEWTLSSDAGTVGGLAIPGWNVFQFKARSIAGQTRSQVVSKLKSSLKGAAIELTKRLSTANKNPSHYALFTNLQLGLATPTETAAGATLSKDREELEAAIRDGSPGDLAVTIIDAGNIAAELNANAALKLTYFAPGIATTWEDKWNAERATSGQDHLIPLIGRDDVLKECASWLADDAVRIIALDGANGMGKTRLALEATRVHRSRTTVVEAADEFERLPLAALAVAPVPRIFILEDPDADQAKRIATMVMAQPRLKLIITLPTRDKAPWFSANETGMKYHSLAPLERDPAAKLLKAANPNIDGSVADWIHQSAGGIPFVILNAAHYGNELRDKVGTLKQVLAQKFIARIEKEIGPEGVDALRLISPLQWTLVAGEKSELPTLAEIFRPNLAVPRILELIDRLARMGFAGRRGEYRTVTPPIFASALAENVFAAVPTIVRALFDRATDDGRRRLLERVVTLELSDVEPFWTHVFERCGANAEKVLAHAGMFHPLARANPLATARCLERNVAELVQIYSGHANSTAISHLTTATRELIYHDRTCAAGMRIMQVLAIGLPDGSADRHFHDAFVHWFYSFPLPYSERLDWLKRLLGSTNPAERQLGAEALEHATSIPHTMSGYEVTARRMGAAPVSRLWSEVHDYLEGIFSLRFQHLADSDRIIASSMAKGLTNALTRLADFLPPERTIKVLGAFMQLYRGGAVSAAPVDVRRLLEFTSSSYGEKQQRAEAQHRPRWDAPLAQLEIWRKEFDEGPFALRFKLAVARVHDWKEVEFEDRKMSANDMRARQLAREVITNPTLMTEELWQLSESPEAWTFHPFIAALCEYDAERKFLPLLEARAQRAAGERNLATYLVVLNQSDANLARARFDALALTLPKSALLAIMDMFRHPPEHRQLLRLWMAEKSVTPEAVGISLGRRSMDDVPPDELAAILEYVATDPNTDQQVIHVLSSYVYRDKPLPRELFPLALRLLKSIKCSNNVHYECSVVAVAISRTHKETAFALFHDQVTNIHSAANYPLDDHWDPLGRFKAHNFWEHLVATWPDDAYRALLGLKGIDFNEVSGPLLNLTKHREILFQLCKDVVAARFFAARLGGAQEGFFDLAYALLSLHPADAELRQALIVAAMSESFDQSFSADHFRQVVARLETRLKDTTTPTQHRSWLESARERALDGRREEERMWGTIDQRPDWD
ncbi:hypothetical protein DB347_20295 [Opitutaceae bacterium EW11]|nr:hypothetical protein DB347_20295 [Opitutaceae bacterium EW11]